MDHLKSTSLKDLEQMYRNEKNTKIKLRLLMVLHRKMGKDYRAIADILLVSVGKVHFWVQGFSKKGIAGLQRKYGSGVHKRYLNKEQEKQLKEKLKKDPMTTKEAWIYIKDNFGKEYHPNSIPRLLKRLGQALITPRPRDYEANPRSESAFRGHIKKVKFVEI